MNRTAKIALFGCGYWGKNLARNLANLGVLSGVYDPDFSKKEAIANQHQVNAYRNTEEVFIDSNIKAIVIATPTPTHHDLAKAALLNGKDVFIEKPMTTNSADAWELVKIAKDKNLVIGTGHTTLYNVAFQKLVSLVRNNELGKIKYIETRQYKSGRMKTTEDIVWDAMPHELSIALALTNEEPILSEVVKHQLFHPYPADIATMHLTFRNNIYSQHCASWVSPQRDRWTIVVGENKTAVFTDTSNEEKALVLFEKNFICNEKNVSFKDNGSKVVPISWLEPLYQEMKDFVDAVECRNKQPLSDGLLGFKIVKILESATQIGGN